MRQQIRNEAVRIVALSQEEKQDKFNLLSKLLNMRDNLNKQIFYSSLYRKLVIWNDLSIQPDEYCHAKVVDCINQINRYQDELNYMPTKLAFEEVNLDTPGYFNFNESAEVQSDSTDTLDALVASLIEMENLIKKNFMMAPEKLEQFARTNPTQVTLRDQVEELNKDLAELKNKHKKMLEQFYSKNKDDSNQIDQKDQIEKLKTELKVRDAQVENA